MDQIPASKSVYLWMVVRVPDDGNPVCVADDLSKSEALQKLAEFNKAQERKPHKHWYDAYHYARGEKLDTALRRKILPFWSPDG